MAATAPTLRRRLTGNWPALPAAAAGFAGLLPSLPEPSIPNPLPALAGLLGGVVLLVLADRRPRLTAPAIGAGLALTLLLAPTATLSALGDTRLSTASPERADLVRVAFAQFATAPITGVGRLDLAYLDHTGVPVLARFVHQEYLQLAAETGLIGLGLVLAGAVALAIGALRRRTAPGAVAALAVLAGFAVHSAFDFLWHIPVLPLLAVLAAVALIPVPHPHQEQEIS